MNYIDYVNIKQGTKSTRRFSGGNTLPLTQLPFAMAGFVPQTAGSREPWYYHPDDRSLEGVRLTHQPSPWIGDYGALLFLPQTGFPQADAGARWSSYRPEEAVLRPDYMRLLFLRSSTMFELAPTQRGAAIRLTYSTAEQPYFSVLPTGGFCSYQMDIQKQRLTGYTTCHHMDIAENFRMYFVLQFHSNVVDSSHTLVINSNEQTENGYSVAGENTGIHIALTGQQVDAQIAVSYISEEQAFLNLLQDGDQQGFDAIHKSALNQWEQYLSRIQVETETEDQLRTFYSCMYRVFLYPHKCYEYDENGQPVHYCPHDGSVRPGYRYTDNGFWDTYRTVFPLFSIIAKKEYTEMLHGFIQDYRDGGWLPRWLSIGEIGCMPSTLIDAVIADAAVKGIADAELLETALQGMLHHATTDAPDKRFGRNGASAYIHYGYVPRDIENQSVNLTLDAAYGDFCIAQTAQILGRPDIEAPYRKRSENYRRLFDPQTGFMRGKDTNGRMAPDFNPLDWGGEYTEGSAWQNSFSVPHDIEGLARLYGGREQLLAKLDELFATKPVYRVGAYGTEIHEMSEMAAVDFGQCAISNQPSFHLPYLYAALGQREKTCFWVEKICRELFSFRDDGFPGDEDNGSMSAWYIFSCLGFYPLCPGKPEYIQSKMLVNKVKINNTSWNSDSLPAFIPHQKLPR